MAYVTGEELHAQVDDGQSRQAMLYAETSTNLKAITSHQALDMSEVLYCSLIDTSS